MALMGIIGHIIILVTLMTVCLGTTLYITTTLVNHKAIGERGAQRETAISDYNDFMTLNVKSIKEITPIAQTNREAILELAVEIFNATKVPTNLDKMATVSWPDYERRFEFNFGKRVYTHFDNALCYEIYQSINSWFLLVEGYNYQWVFHETTYFTPDKGRQFVWKHNSYLTMTISQFLLTGTLVIPAIILIAILMFVLICKFVLFVVRLALMHFFDIVTEKDPKDFAPFTLLASAANLLIFVMNEIVKIWHHV
jgi:hypothetical protein